ncbi:MAG TPA: protein-L-isoaspartate O-methyltransferase, partial [Aestuariivirgaceae bacterium]
MFDFAAARRMMVDSQERPSDVTDQRIIAAMSELP